MTNILTSSEAAAVLRCGTDDPDMLALLPLVDAYIREATGHDWTTDSPIRAEAKSGARILITLWHENPGQIGSGLTSLGSGLTATLVQLEALALRYKGFEGISGAGGIDLPGVRIGDTVESVTGLIGVTGDQSAAFEDVISVDGQIQQVSTSDLTGKFYRAYLIPLESL
jgi:hypothetical protein